MRKAAVAILVSLTLAMFGSTSTAAAKPPAPPLPGAPGIGDPYFPTDGNGGYDVKHYDLTIDYRPATDLLHGRAVITARATQALSRFDLDFNGLTVDSVR